MIELLCHMTVDYDKENQKLISTVRNKKVRADQTNRRKTKQ